MSKISFKGESGNVSVGIKDFTQDERCDFNDIIYGKTYGKLLFSDYVKLVKLVTDITDEQLKSFSDKDLIQIADQAYSIINNKKK